MKVISAEEAGRKAVLFMNISMFRKVIFYVIVCSEEKDLLNLLLFGHREVTTCGSRN